MSRGAIGQYKARLLADKNAVPMFEVYYDKFDLLRQLGRTAVDCLAIDDS